MTMSLNSAHRGYQYQDLATAYFLLQSIVSGFKEITVDRKRDENDRFDDLEILIDDRTIRRQFKYGDDTNRIFELEDLKTDRKDLRIDKLVQYYIDAGATKADEYRVCTTWALPIDTEFTALLEPISTEPSFSGHSTRCYRLRGDLIWSKGASFAWKPRIKPLSISRENFLEFVDHFVIELQCPPFSSDLNNPGTLERLLLNLLTNSIGVGQYPNRERNPVDVAATIVYLASQARAEGKTLTPPEIISSLRLRTDYGRVAQQFPLDKAILVERSNLLDDLTHEIENGKIVVLTGAPGAGKSWTLTRLTEKLIASGHLVAKHYCYLEPGDPEIQRRITTDVLFANLLYEIISAEPALKEKNQPVYSSGPRELENILREAVAIRSNGLIVLVVDGIDHISRILPEAHSIAPEDTNIIQQLATLDLPDGICLVIGSQPGNHLAPFDATGKTVSITDWNLQETNCLAQRLGTFETLRKAGFDNLENDFAALLHEKSEGNPLYATFLCREFIFRLDSGIAIAPLAFLQVAPALEGNLSRYYDYLLADVELNGAGSVADVLGLIDFGLTLQELQEILPPLLKHRISSAIDRLNPILKQVTNQGGIRIYHESFRRFIVERLKSQDCSIADVVAPVIQWLEHRGFYKDSKAYRFLLPCLRRAGRKQEILHLIEFDFVSRSIESGHPRSALQANLILAIEMAAEELDWVSLVRFSELHRSIYTCYDEKLRDLDLFKLYGQTFAELFGMDALVERLLFDGRPTIPAKPGLILCSLCDDAGHMPPWSEYLELEKKEPEENSSDSEWIPVAIAQFHGLLRLKGSETMCDSLLDWLAEAEELSLKYLQGILSKLLQIGGIESFNYLMDQTNITGEIASIIKVELAKYISNLGNSKKAQEIASHALQETTSIELAVDCLELGVESDEVAKSFSNLTEIITGFDHTLEDEPLRQWIAALRIVAVTVPEQLIDLKKRFKGGNWYQNWLYFTVVLAEAEVKAKQNLTSAQTDLIEAIECLASDTQPFKGEPRTCDLYSLEATIHKSIARALDLLKTSTQWKDALECLVKVTNETTTDLQRTPVGPLVHYALISLLLPYTSEPSLYDSTFEIISQLVVQVEQSGQLYGLHAEYEMDKILALFRGGNVDLARNCWKNVGKYLCAYGSRKDGTIDELLDSLPALKRVNLQNTRAAIKKVQPLVDAVLVHTDGKGTKHSHNSWYEALCEADIVAGLILLAQSLTLDGGALNWRLENAVNEALNSVRLTGNPLVLSFLFGAYPFDGSGNSAKSRLDVVKRLIEVDPVLGEFHFRLLTAQVQGDSEKFSLVAWQCLEDFADVNNLELASGQCVVGLEKNEDQSTHKGSKVAHPQINVVIPTFQPNSTPLEIMKGVREFCQKTRFNKDSNNCFVNAFGYRLIELIESDAENEAIQLIRYLANEYYTYEDASLLAELGQGLELSGFHRVAAIAFTLAYCCSRGGGGWLKLGGSKYESWLIHALKLDREETLHCLTGRVAHFLYESTYVAGIARHLIEVCAVQGEVELAFRAWDAAFQVIQHRLPSHETTIGLFLPYLPDEVPAWSLDEGLVLLLLARVTHPELERKMAALSGLATLVCSIPNLIIAPLREFFKRDIPITTVLSVLGILQCSELVPYTLSTALQDELKQLTQSKIFGIRVLAQTLLQRIGVKLDTLYRSCEFTAPPVDSNKHKAIISLDWGERVEQLTSIWNEFPTLIAARFDQLWQGSELYSERANSRYRASSGFSKRNLPSTEILTWEQEIFESVFHEILNGIDIQLWNKGEWSLNAIQEIAEHILPSIKTQVARWNSRSIRPSLPLPNAQKSSISHVVAISGEDSYNGWYRCGYYERELILERETLPDLKCEIKIYAGIEFSDQSLLRSNQIPFGFGNAEQGWFWEEKGGTQIYLNSFYGPLVGFACTRDYLGCRPILVLHPNLSIRCGLYPGRYPGHLELVDSQGKSAVLFRWWNVRPLGDELYEQTPILQGYDLILRPDIFEKICQFSTRAPIETKIVR